MMALLTLAAASFEVSNLFFSLSHSVSLIHTLSLCSYMRAHTHTQIPVYVVGKHDSGLRFKAWDYVVWYMVLLKVRKGA